MSDLRALYEAMWGNTKPQQTQTSNGQQLAQADNAIDTIAQQRAQANKEHAEKAVNAWRKVIESRQQGAA